MADLDLIANLMKEGMKRCRTRARFAAESGLDPESISAYLIKRIKRPTDETLLKISNFFGVPMWRLRGEAPPSDITPEMKQLPAPSKPADTSAEAILLLVKSTIKAQEKMDKQIACIEKRFDIVLEALRRVAQTGNLESLETLGDKG